MRRREALTMAWSSIVMSGAAGLTGCTERHGAAAPIDLDLPAFSEEAFHKKLDALRVAFDLRNPKTTQHLQPGLSEDTIRAKTAWFPGPIPREIVALYKWRNGFAEPSGFDGPPFRFRDCVFTPLEMVEKNYRSMVKTYGAFAPTADVVAHSFPFASLDGGWLVLPAKAQSLQPKIQRPVISVFQGISVFFYSMEKMAETCAAWVVHPNNDGFSLPAKDEMEIWQKINPGIFAK